MDADHPADLVYVYKPSLMGAPWEFRLAPDALVWQAGRRSGRIAYPRIRRIRLSFRPVTMQSRRFVTEIWADDGLKLQIASTSWRTMLEQARCDDPYARFLVALHHRLDAKGVSLEAGVMPFAYWAGIAVFAASSVALAALTARALQVEAWAGAAFIGGFLALFLWQVGGYFRRNRPRIYRSDSLPADLVPRPQLRTTSTEQGA
jgi:hypothetical protein